MKITLFTSNNNRHNYLINLLSEASDQLTMQTSDNKIKFNLGNMKLISKVIDGKFPDYRKVVPIDNKKSLTSMVKVQLLF